MLRAALVLLLTILFMACSSPTQEAAQVNILQLLLKNKLSSNSHYVSSLLPAKQNGEWGAMFPDSALKKAGHLLQQREAFMHELITTDYNSVTALQQAVAYAGTLRTSVPAPAYDPVLDALYQQIQEKLTPSASPTEKMLGLISLSELEEQTFTHIGKQFIGNYSTAASVLLYTDTTAAKKGEPRKLVFMLDPNFRTYPYVKKPKELEQLVRVDSLYLVYSATDKIALPFQETPFEQARLLQFTPPKAGDAWVVGKLWISDPQNGEGIPASFYRRLTITN